MPEAARLYDPIGHSPTMSGLLAGLLIGAAIGVAAVAIAGTCGLAAGAIIGGAAAAGAGIGEIISTLSFVPKDITGKIITGSLNVFTNSRNAARAHLDKVLCSKHPPSPHPVIATGSDSVFINGQPAARVTDKITCAAVIVEGSPNVFIGGGTIQTDDIAPEDLVPGYIHAALLVVGLGAAVILAGPVVAVAGFAGGMAGGYGGSVLGGTVFGEGSDGQKLSMLAGAFAVGWMGAKGGQAIAAKAIPTPVTPKEGFIKGGLKGMEETQQNRYEILKAKSEQRAQEIREAPKTDWPNNRKPLKTSTVMDKKTGKVYQDDSGYPLAEEIHPDLKSKMPNPSLEEHVPENCAEIKAANHALKDGAKIDDLDVYTVKSTQKGGGEPAPRCENCKVTLDGATVYSDPPGH